MNITSTSKRRHRVSIIMRLQILKSEELSMSMEKEIMNKLIDTELVNLNKLVYELEGGYSNGDPKLIYFQMRQRLEMLEAAADWTRIIQSRLDNDEDTYAIAKDFVDFVTSKYGVENLKWFYHHIEVTSRTMSSLIFTVIRSRQ